MSIQLIQNSLVRAWKWWFTPRSSDPTIIYRERALRTLLPVIFLLRFIGTLWRAFNASTLSEPFAPQWLLETIFYVPAMLSFYLLLRQKVDAAGMCFLFYWYTTDMLSLPAEGYWYPGFQISLIIQIVIGALLLPSRAIFPFLFIQISTFGLWSGWLDSVYYDPPLLSSGYPVAVFHTTFITLAVQETIILFIVRYLRLAMEKSLRLQQVSIQQLEAEVAERQRAEKMRENLILELEQRNAELERLAYTLSHELKSPLITIRGFSGYMREDARNGNLKRLEVDAQRVTDGTEKMLRIINELIELMSVGRVVSYPEKIPLRTLVDEALQLVRERIVERNIIVCIADDLPYVYGDHQRLLEVLQNLLENAVKFMGEQPEPKIEIGQRYKEDGTPTFYVRDNGIGINLRFADRIFGIFHKLDALSEGTGIGLALVKRIIEIHGGKIWVESEGPGKGSTFCFMIPDGRKAEN